MTASDYREMIYSIVIPGHLSCEERNQRYQPLADFLKSEIPERLYRFRTCDDRKINEFEQDILGFSPAHKMNDDFDGLLYFDKKRILQGLDDLTPLAFQKYINSEGGSANCLCLRKRLQKRLLINSPISF